MGCCCSSSKPKAKTQQKGKVKAPMLGVVKLDSKYPGSKQCAASMGYDVMYKEVPKLTFDMAVKGEMTAEVGKNFDDAIKFLQSQGCSAITGDCGFMMAFQKRARQVASVPAFMSSMVQCPAISCALEPAEKIMIMTASAPDLQKQKTQLLKQCGFDVESSRYIIVGLEGIPAFNGTSKDAPVSEVQATVVKVAAESIKKNPTIRAILLECTELPPYADALRAVTGLPVFDCITAADFFKSAFIDDPRFGLNDWQETIKTATKKPNDTQLKKVADNLSKRQNPILGCIRLDFNFDGAKVGDVQNAGSFGYQVIYKAVPGLTFELAQKGTMTPQVEQDFKNSIKFLESKGATCITGDCGFFMAYQKIARDAANVPVFMSSMVQCPIVSTAFDMEEKILILTANSESLTPQKSVLLSSCGFNVDDGHFVIEGCQDIPGFEAVLEGKVADVPKIEKGMMTKIKGVLQKNPSIKAIVCECHGLPQWADVMRKASGLPVFDIVTCADFFISSVADNPRFGLNEWQAPWDKQMEEYKFGQGLTAEEKERLSKESQDRMKNK